MSRRKSPASTAVTTAKKGTRKAVTAAKFGAVGAAASLLAWDAFDAVKQIRANRRGPRGQALRNQIARQPPLQRFLARDAVAVAVEVVVTAVQGRLSMVEAQRVLLRLKFVTVAAACNQGTANAHESVPEDTGAGAPVFAHNAIPGTANVTPCGDGGQGEARVGEIPDQRYRESAATTIPETQTAEYALTHIFA